MRRTSFTLYLIFICTSLSAQYTRSLYPTTLPGFPRTTAIAAMNGENYFLSIKESSNDTIRMLTGHIDALGETDAYSEYTIPSAFSSIAVSGMGGDNTGSLLAVLITNNFGLGAVHYVRIDPISGSAQIEYTLPFDTEGPFGPTRIKGNSLVTYITQEGVGLVRISADISNPSNYTYELVDPAVTLNGSLSAGIRHIEFKMDNNANEYVCTAGKLFKRTAANTYQNTVLSFITSFEPMGLTLDISNNGTVLVMTPTKHELLNSALTSIGSGMNNFEINSSTRFFELRSVAGLWKFYAQSMDQQMKEITFDNAFSFADHRIIGPNIQPHGTYSVGGIPYLIAERKSSVLGYSNSLSMIGFMQLNGSNIEPFIEFGQQIEHDRLHAGIGHIGADFISDDLEPGVRYEHGGVERTVLYYAASYVVGNDLNGNLYSNFIEPNIMPNLPGPYCPGSIGNLELMDRYCRGYYVSRDMIDNHITMITNGNPGYVIPFGIREWPAHGNTAIGQAANLAPFVDQNNNGVYEPELGDYPSIYGTQCVLNMYHGNPDANLSGIEHHQYIYTMECDTNETINSTIFVTQRIFARNGDYTEAIFTKYSDSDLGNPLDDFLGSNVELAMTYFYNGDLNDEPSGYGNHFNDTLPALGFQILKAIKIADDGMDNDGTGGFPVNAYGLSDGTVDNEFTTMESSLRHLPNSVQLTNPMLYNIVQGIYPDGTPNSVNGVDVRFDYFGNSDPDYYASGGINHGNNNSELSAGNESGDRSIWSNSGQFDLTPSTVVEITAAYLTAIDTNTATTNVLEPVQRLFSLAANLKELYGNNYAGCELTFYPYESDLTLKTETLEALPDFAVYPNPTSGELFVRTDEQGSCNWQLVDMQGNLLQSGEMTGQTVISLDTITSGIYLLNLQMEGQTVSKRIVKF